jgi:hypothetical protein
MKPQHVASVPVYLLAQETRKQSAASRKSQQAITALVPEKQESLAAQTEENAYQEHSYRQLAGGYVTGNAVSSSNRLVFQRVPKA